MNTSISRRALLAATLGTGAAIGLSACNGKSATSPQGPATGDGGADYSGPAVTLVFWNGFTGGDGTTMRQLCDEFTKAHSNVKISMQTMQWSDFNSKLPTAVVAGKAPDVAAMHLDDVPTYAARKAVQPLDDVAVALGLSEDQFAKAPWEAGIYKDVRYSIPLDTHPLGFYYNKTLMEKAGLDPDKPPMTDSDYQDALQKLKAKGIQGHWASPYQFSGGMSVYSLLYQFGGQLLSDDLSQATWAGDEGVKAVTWWQNLITNGYSPAKVAQDADMVAFQNGKTAFHWNGIWNINSFKQVKNLDWGIAPLPVIGESAGVWANSHQFVLPTQKQQDANKLQAAKVFINWISQHSLAWAAGGQIPARNSVRESDGFKKLTQQAILAKQIDDVKFVPGIPGIGDVLAQFYTGVQNIILGGKDIQSALQTSADQANKILQENKKKYQ